MHEFKSIIFNFFREIILFVINPFFILLSIIGNMLIFVFSCLFYYAESGINQDVNEFMDALWWAFSTVTTVGYGDITPDTFLGRIIAIILMLIGTGIFAAYIALFTEVLLKDSSFIRRRRIDKD